MCFRVPWWGRVSGRLAEQAGLGKLETDSRPKSCQGPEQGKFCRVHYPQSAVQNLVAMVWVVCGHPLEGYESVQLPSLWPHICPHSVKAAELWPSDSMTVHSPELVTHSFSLLCKASFTSLLPPRGREGGPRSGSGTQLGTLACFSGLTTLGLNGGWISRFSSFSQSILLKKACSLTSLSPSGPQPSRLAGCLVIS